MNRSLKLSILVALTLSSAQALALGLGQIRVKSALNKPLVAEIPLRVDYPGEADKLQVSLASSDQFARAGLDRMSLSVQLKFKVTTNAAGQKVILVTSDEPVRESFLDFLVKVDWPRGQLLREYTVLLDPPVMAAPTRLQGAVAPASVKPAPAPTPSAPKPVTSKPAPAPSRPVPPAPQPQPSAPAPAPTPTAASAQGHAYGPVASGQTLWGIARKLHGSDVSVNQMMVALKSVNPDAFYKDNINALKKGAVLRIPTRDELDANNAAAATAEVMRQNHAWQAVAPSRPTMVAKAGNAAPRTPATQPARAAGGSSGDHLKLVPPSEGGESTGARAGAAKGSDKVTIEKLHQDVARAKEALSSAKQQTADLQTRLKSLKDIQDKNDRLMSLKNAEIAELQNKLAESGKPVPSTSAASPAMSGSVAAAASSTGPAAAVSAGKPAASTSVAANNKVAKKPPVKPVQPVRHPATEAAEPWYTTLWAKGVAAGVLLLALIGLVLRGRGGKKGSATRSTPSLADQFGTSPLGDELSEQGVDEELDELLHQLAEHPDDIDTHLELVSLYYARRDVEGFESAAEAMHAHISDPDQPEWRDVMTMGEELAPDYPLFAAAANAYEPVVPDEHETVEAHDEAQGDLPEPEAEAPSETSGAEHDYGFDLTTGTASETEEVGGQAIEAPSEDEYDALPPLPAEEPAPVAEPEASADDLSDLDFPGLDLEDDTATTTDAPMPSEPVPEHDLDMESVESDLTMDVAEPQDEGAAAPAGLGGDAVDTKIELARAYMDMGDPEGARAMLEEAMAEGDDAQRDVAQKLLDELD